MRVDGIYTTYLSGSSGQGLAMFVFLKGKIAGADASGLTFSGTYVEQNDRVVGNIRYSMPAGSISITGMSFERQSDEIVVPIDLPSKIEPFETYRINTPIGPLNARFVRNITLE